MSVRSRVPPTSRRKGSLFFRTALFSITVVLLTLVAFALRVVVYEARTLRENLDTQAKLLAVSLDRVVSNALAKGDTREAVNQCLDTLRVSRQAAYIGITDGNGTTWLQTHGGTTVIDGTGETLAGLLPTESGVIVYSNLMRREVLHSHYPLTRLPNTPGSLQIGLDVSDYRRAMQELLGLVLSLAVPGLLIGLLSSVLFARYLTKPIARLEKFAARVARGKLNARVKIRSKTEIGRLGEAMNTMTSEIERSQLELQRLVDLEKIVSGAGAELTKLDADDLEIGVKNVLQNVTDFLEFEHFAVIKIDKQSRLFAGECHNLVQNALLSPLRSVCEATIRTQTTEHPKKGCFTCHIAARPGMMPSHSVVVLPLGDAGIAWGAACFLREGDVPCSENEMRILLLLGRIIHNLLQRRSSERERLKLLHSLNRSQKLEAIGTLSGGIAHDFNNMLVPIIGYSDSILNGNDDLRGHRKEIVEIRKAAESAASLTKQLLAFSRKQILQKNSIDINTSIDNFRPMLQRLVGDGIVIAFDQDAELWPVEADRSQIEQVIMNACLNAKDAMPDGGELRISTKNVHLKAATEDEPSGKFVQISIEDSGIGIEKEALDRIFDPFYTTKGHKATGLGLSVVLGIIEQHGGWIHVESEPGLGARFLLHLPAQVDSEGGDETNPGLQEPSSEAGAHQPSLLVVEDEPSVLAFVSQALVRAGYRVSTASSMAAALAAYEQRQEGFDLVFSDVVLPDGTGMEIVEKVLEIYPEQRVLLTSGFTDARALLDKAFARQVLFLHKPYSLETLYRKVEEALAHDRLQEGVNP